MILLCFPQFISMQVRKCIKWWLHRDSIQPLVYFSSVAVWVLRSQMEVIQICGWHEFFIICIFFLMAAQLFNAAADQLFTITWWLTVVPLVQPVIDCFLSNGGWQCLQPSQDWLPNLILAGNQDTRIQYFFYPCRPGTYQLPTRHLAGTNKQQTIVSEQPFTTPATYRAFVVLEYSRLVRLKVSVV